MEGDTPTFYQDSTTNIFSSCFSFSEAYDNSLHSKPQSRHSSFHKSHKKHKSEKKNQNLNQSSKKKKALLKQSRNIFRIK